jgi:hypothetical protein
MKCPYRTIITEIKTGDWKLEKDTEFKECLYKECPFYQPEITEGWDKCREGCWKVANEVNP